MYLLRKKEKSEVRANQVEPPAGGNGVHTSPGAARRLALRGRVSYTTRASMVDDAGSFLAGRRRFGRYEATGLLGRGAMGEVFEARHIELGTRVAIKVVHEDATIDPGAARRVVREGRAAAAIRHPHVVTVLDVGTESGFPFLVMELLEGEDLAKRLARDGPLSVVETADLLLPVTSAVAAAHDAGVVHRDLKPSNVFLAQRRGGVEPVVVDFGISKTRHGTEPTTSSHGVAGTVLYMAPEVIRGHDATPESDQYALGILLYECAVGSAPFCNDDRYELLNAIMTGPIVAPSDLNPRVSPSFDTVVLRALSRDPVSRFQSVRALGAALLPFASEETRRRWGAELGLAREGRDSFTMTAAPSPNISATRQRKRLRGRHALWVLLPVGLLAVYGASLRSAPHNLPVTSPPQPPETRPVAASDLAPASIAGSPGSTESPAVVRESNSGKAIEPKGAPTPAPPQRHAPRIAPAAPAAPAARTDAPPQEAMSHSIERGTRNIPIVE
ncbi:MAG TPA: serine/threonine-protein kinase [Polyangiaceae bacterium]|jgi:serine/threonine-protein kinase|nr:serine/threonine-protein kinase [Polyangiaceae bacterium]